MRLQRRLLPLVIPNGACLRIRVSDEVGNDIEDKGRDANGIIYKTPFY